ncbi:MAG: ribosome silencing factor [Burkholderiaceae bacterium]|jgi:ribosome-associated protein
MSTKTDIHSLQHLIVGALEDVKGKDIVVFDTEHLSALFERVIIVSGTSNRQTKALASSVRDEVRDAGLPKPRVEGEGNGEWIIVDCGSAVVHVMQPIIREYYRLEEIWGDKPVRIKLAKTRGLAKASEPMAQDTPAAKKPGTKKPAAVKTTTRPVAATKASPAKKAAPAKKVVSAKRGSAPVAAKIPAKKALAPTTKPKTVTVNKPKPAAKKAVVRKSLAKVPTKTPSKSLSKTAAKSPAKAVTKPAAKSAAKKIAPKRVVAKKPAAKKAK